MTNSNDVSVVDQALHIARSSSDLLVVVGPTASGKTRLAVALAEELGGEIVSADSVQIYREFDIGSGKPGADEIARAPHHLVSMVDPLAAVDAVAWAELASRSLAEIRSRGRVPIVCGGTFFWIRALLFGLVEAPAGSQEVRERHRVIAESEGRASLFARLRTVDADTAARLHPNDFVRVSRALEVYELSGKPMSGLQREHAFARERHRARLIGVAHDHASLTDRMRARVAAWLAQGWIEEVEGLLARGFGGARAMGSVGYRQVRAMLEGALPRDEMAEAIVRSTRVFARRQRTWLNRAPVTWLSAG